jgi:proline iminopeptidase
VQELHDQMPFQFADPHDPRIEDYERHTAGAIYSTDVLRRFASEEYGGIEVEDRLGDVTQPVLVLAGRHDRTCSVEAAQAIAEGVRQGELVVFESSADMTFVEENDAYIRTVRDFLRRHAGSGS